MIHIDGGQKSGSGTTRYRIPQLIEHVETNLRLVETILGARTRISQNLMVEIEGVAFGKPEAP